MPDGPEQVICSIRLRVENVGGHPFEMEIHTRADRCRIEISGIATLAAAGALERALTGLSATRPRHVEIDTVRIVSMSCLATAALLDFCRAVQRWRGVLVLVPGASLRNAWPGEATGAHPR